MAASPTREEQRADLVRRYLELRPSVLAAVSAGVPDEIRAGFGALTPRQLQALMLLPEEGLSMSRLAAALGVTQATASTLAGRLVAQGLANRTHGSPDRRTVRLTPTAAGLDLAWRYRHLQLHAADGVFDRLTEQQAEQLLYLMEILAAAPARELATEVRHCDLTDHRSHARPDDGRNQEVRA